MAAEVDLNNKDIPTSRYINWRFIGYPDSLPPDYLNILQEEFQVSFAVSPLHDMDIVPDTGEVKKAHYHFVISFDGKKSYSQVKVITDKLNCPIPKPCDSIRGSIRYFIHADNPDKAQYSRDGIQSYGIDIEPYFSCSGYDRLKILQDLVNIINQQGFTDYDEIVDFVRDRIDTLDYFEVVSHNTLFLKTYLFGKRDKFNGRQKDK